jgi:Enoyl-CoA hydratase/carnithine racemase
MLQIVEGKKPVIAKVRGAAFAAGCQLVSSCDLTYSTKDALFATSGVKYRIILAYTYGRC